MTEEQKPLEILVIDDDIRARKLLGDFIQIAGANATTAVDGQDGINKYVEMFEAGTPYDPVFTDLSMPNATGVDVTKKVKELSPKALVYIMTAEVDKYKELSAQLGELKPDGVIQKPLDLNSIKNLVEQIKSYLSGTIENIPAYQPPTHQS